MFSDLQMTAQDQQPLQRGGVGASRLGGEGGGSEQERDDEGEQGTHWGSGGREEVP